jgi:predicted RNA binding protein YcfA (HicA-like mRNA interferase family)
MSCVKTHELIRMLEQNGWYRVRQRGSHAIYRHASKPGQLTVPMHEGKAHRDAAHILKKAGPK